MSKKMTLTITVILLLLIGFVLFMNKSIFQNESTAGSENNNVEATKGQEVERIKQSNLLKDINKPNVTIVDIREPQLYAKSHIPTSINIPFVDFRKRYQELDKNKLIILVCHMGGMGEAGGQFLLQNGFQHVLNLAGGMSKWTGPVENNK